MKVSIFSVFTQVAALKLEILVYERQRCDLNSSSNGEWREGESGKKGIRADTGERRLQ
jgi:hypothetical protein